MAGRGETCAQHEYDHLQGRCDLTHLHQGKHGPTEGAYESVNGVPEAVKAWYFIGKEFHQVEEDSHNNDWPAHEGLKPGRKGMDQLKSTANSHHRYGRI